MKFPKNEQKEINMLQNAEEKVHQPEMTLTTTVQRARPCTE